MSTSPITGSSPESRYASEVIAAYRFVSYTDNNSRLELALTAAGATPNGVSLTTAAAIGDLLTMAPLSSERIVQVEAAGSITYGNAVYVAASGKVSATPSGDAVGTALNSASAGGMVAIRVTAPFLANARQAIRDIVVDGDDFVGDRPIITAGDFYAGVSSQGGSEGYTSTGDGSVEYTTDGNGVLKINATTTTNQQHLIARSTNAFKFEAAKRYYFPFRTKLTGPSNAEVGIFFGLSSVVTTNGLVDTTGALREAGFDGIGIHKAAADTTFKAVAANGANFVSEDTAINTAVDSAAYVEWVFIVEPDPAAASTRWRVLVLANGAQVATLSNANLTYAGSSLMKLFGTIKGFDTPASAPYLEVDFWQTQADRVAAS